MRRIEFKPSQPKQEFSKITNRRQYLIKQFLDTLNLDRKPPYKPLTPGRVATMLSPLDTTHLEQFLEECKAANHFSKHYWYSFKPPKQPL